MKLIIGYKNVLRRFGQCLMWKNWFSISILFYYLCHILLCSFDNFTPSFHECTHGSQYAPCGRDTRHNRTSDVWGLIWASELDIRVNICDYSFISERANPDVINGIRLSNVLSYYRTREHKPLDKSLEKTAATSVPHTGHWRLKLENKRHSCDLCNGVDILKYCSVKNSIGL